MKSDFAVFILSHERAETMTTYVLLKKSNYSGELFVVIDSEDKQKKRYVELYGEKVIVFDLEEQKRKPDTMTNDKTGSAIYARQFITGYASERYEYYAMLDDDIKNIEYRYIRSGRLKSKKIRDINKMFKTMIWFMKQNESLFCIGPGHAGSFIGGKDGKYKEGIIFGNLCQFFLFRSGNIKWTGLFSHDTITSLKYGKVGSLFLQVLLICHSSPERKSNKGGLHDDYKKQDDYCMNFRALICEPSCVKITVQNKEKPYHINIKRNNAYPKIISGKYKK